jgi:predicted  nucleic acid-binding Zn-ribbon protein
MTRTRDKVALACLLLLGAWGCGRGPATADLQKKQLETRTAKLETDLSETTARLNEAEQQIAREQARTRAAERAAEQKLTAAEGKFTREQARGAALEREKDDLYGRLKATVGQRDATQAQLDSLVKKIEGVLVETRAAMAKPGVGDKTDDTKATAITAKAGD